MSTHKIYREMRRGKPTLQQEGLVTEGPYLEGEVEPGLIKQRIAMQPY